MNLNLANAEIALRRKLLAETVPVQALSPTQIKDHTNKDQNQQQEGAGAQGKLTPAETQQVLAKFQPLAPVIKAALEGTIALRRGLQNLKQLTRDPAEAQTTKPQQPPQNQVVPAGQQANPQEEKGLPAGHRALPTPPPSLVGGPVTPLNEAKPGGPETPHEKPLTTPFFGMGNRQTANALKAELGQPQQALPAQKPILNGHQLPTGGAGGTRPLAPPAGQKEKPFVRPEKQAMAGKPPQAPVRPLPVNPEKGEKVFQAGNPTIAPVTGGPTHGLIPRPPKNPPLPSAVKAGQTVPAVPLNENPAFHQNKGGAQDQLQHNPATRQAANLEPVTNRTNLGNGQPIGQVQGLQPVQGNKGGNGEENPAAFPQNVQGGQIGQKTNLVPPFAEKEALVHPASVLGQATVNPKTTAQRTVEAAVQEGLNHPANPENGPVGGLGNNPVNTKVPVAAQRLEAPNPRAVQPVQPAHGALETFATAIGNHPFAAEAEHQNPSATAQEKENNAEAALTPLAGQPGKQGNPENNKIADQTEHRQAQGIEPPRAVQPHAPGNPPKPQGLGTQGQRTILPLPRNQAQNEGLGKVIKAAPQPKGNRGGQETALEPLTILVNEARAFRGGPKQPMAEPENITANVPANQPPNHPQEGQGITEGQAAPAIPLEIKNPPTNSVNITPKPGGQTVARLTTLPAATAVALKAPANRENLPAATNAQTPAQPVNPANMTEPENNAVTPQAIRPVVEGGAIQLNGGQQRTGQQNITGLGKPQENIPKNAQAIHPVEAATVRATTLPTDIEPAPAISAEPLAASTGTVTQNLALGTRPLVIPSGAPVGDNFLAPGLTKDQQIQEYQRNLREAASSTTLAEALKAAQLLQQHPLVNSQPIISTTPETLRREVGSAAETVTQMTTHESNNRDLKAEIVARRPVRGDNVVSTEPIERSEGAGKAPQNGSRLTEPLPSFPVPPLLNVNRQLNQTLPTNARSRLVAIPTVNLLDLSL